GAGWRKGQTPGGGPGGGPVRSARGGRPAVTVTVSIFEPMSNLMTSPAVMLTVDVTLMFLAPAAAAADNRACVPGLPTAVMVATSSFGPKPMAILWPTVNPDALVIGALVEPAGIVTGPSGSGCPSGGLAAGGLPGPSSGRRRPSRG